MKSSKTLLAFVALSFAAAGFVFAADKAENKAGNNCTKCGGSGKIEKKADAKK